MDNPSLWLLIWIVSVLLGAAIGQYKNRLAAGTVFGALAGPIGWLAVAIGPNMRPKCPECGGAIELDVRKCRHCGSTIAIQRDKTPLDPLENDPLPPQLPSNRSSATDDNFDSIVDSVTKR